MLNWVDKAIVSILVLMDDGILRQRGLQARKYKLVSILVLMDDGILPQNNDYKNTNKRVSILVLMDDGILHVTKR